jgi:hypothetical protein
MNNLEIHCCGFAVWDGAWLNLRQTFDCSFHCQADITLPLLPDNIALDKGVRLITQHSNTRVDQYSIGIASAASIKSLPICQFAGQIAENDQYTISSIILLCLFGRIWGFLL